MVPEIHLATSKRNSMPLCSTRTGWGSTSYRHTNCRNCQIKFGKSRGRDNGSVRDPHMMQMRGLAKEGSAIR